MPSWNGDDLYKEALKSDNPDKFIIYKWNDPAPYFEEFVKPYITTNMDVVEVGSGFGRYTDLILPYCKHMYLIESSMVCRDYLRNKYKSFSILSTEEVKTKLGPSNFIFSISVMHHFNLFEIYWYFKNLIPHLDRGGYCVIQYSSFASDGAEIFLNTPNDNFGDSGMYWFAEPNQMEIIGKSLNLNVVIDKTPEKQILKGHRFVVYRKIL